MKTAVDTAAPDGLRQVGWMKGRMLRLDTGPLRARVRMEPGWQPVYVIDDPPRDGSKISSEGEGT